MKEVRDATGERRSTGEDSWDLLSVIASRLQAAYQLWNRDRVIDRAHTHTHTRTSRSRAIKRFRQRRCIVVLHWKYIFIYINYIRRYVNAIHTQTALRRRLLFFFCFVFTHFFPVSHTYVCICICRYTYVYCVEEDTENDWRRRDAAHRLTISDGLHFNTLLLYANILYECRAVRSCVYIRRDCLGRVTTLTFII